MSLEIPLLSACQCQRLHPPSQVPALPQTRVRWALSACRARSQHICVTGFTGSRAWWAPLCDLDCLPCLAAFGLRKLACPLPFLPLRAPVDPTDDLTSLKDEKHKHEECVGTLRRARGTRLPAAVSQLRRAVRDARSTQPQSDPVLEDPQPNAGIGTLTTSGVKRKRRY